MTDRAVAPLRAARVRVLGAVRVDYEVTTCLQGTAGVSRMVADLGTLQLMIQGRAARSSHVGVSRGCESMPPVRLVLLSARAGGGPGSREARAVVSASARSSRPCRR